MMVSCMISDLNITNFVEYIKKNRGGRFGCEGVLNILEKWMTYPNTKVLVEQTRLHRVY